MTVHTSFFPVELARQLVEQLTADIALAKTRESHVLCVIRAEQARTLLVALETHLCE